MSAIAGIVHFDGAPVDRADLERMSQALQAFGRDGEWIANAGCAGFVARIAHLTPEDRLERQPAMVAGQGQLLFDGRLDNRSELTRQLGLSEAEARQLSDSALATRAWERWGRDSLIRMVGVFGLAHWHAGERRLTLARAAPRGKPIYVHRQGQTLYFASAPHGLFALPQVPRALNESALGDLLLRNTGAGESLYRDIAVVQTAHWAEYRADGGDSRRYWAPDPKHRLHFNREEEAWEAFRPLFEDVVRSQLRAIAPVGIQMSGGLDSAAVAGQAARILAETGQTLRGYTRVPAPGTPLRPDGLFYNDERPRVEAIARMYPNLLPSFVEAGEEPVLAGLNDYFAATYGTFATSPTFVTGYDVLYRRAAADGVRVLLTGASGNLSFSYDGHARLRELLLSGRWLSLYRELRGLRRFRGHVRGLIKSELLESLIPQPLRHAVQRLRNRDHAWSHYSVVTANFAQRSGALGRMRDRNNIKLHVQALDSWQRRACLFTQTGLGGADVCLAQYGIDKRDPSGDRRLIEFSLALPDKFYLHDGIERRMARLGLAHLMPESVRLDTTRGRQDVDWAHRMRRDAYAIGQALAELENDPALGQYLDFAAMRRLWQGIDAIDWQRAPKTEVIRSKQGLMGAVAVGQFIRWFEGQNR